MILDLDPGLVDDRFTQVPNDLVRDRTLTFKARGLWVWMRSNRPGWKTSVRRIAEANGVGVDAVRTGLQELIDAGWLRRSEVQENGGGGRFAGYRYTLTHPRLGNPTVADHPYTGNPHMVNPTPKKTNRSRRPRGEERPSASALVPTETSPTAPSPRCPRHAALPADAAVPPCWACKEARERYEHLDPAREERERLMAERRACARCDDNGITTDGDGLARRCTHPPDNVARSGTFA